MGYFLRATAMYTDGTRPGQERDRKMSEYAVRAVPSGANSPPAFQDDPDAGGSLPTANTDTENQVGVQAMRNVDENTPAGTPFGKPVAAVEANKDTVTYSLGKLTTTRRWAARP